MHGINARNGAEAIWFAAVLAHGKGEKRSPRGQPTRDLGPSFVTLENPCDSVPLGINREGLSPAIGIAEGLSLIAGESHPKMMTALSPFFGELLTQFGEADGAYGPRARVPLFRAVNMLREEPTTRQAVALVWDTLDPRYSSKDVPCTVSFTPFVADNALNLHVAMRSCDVWLGLPYDLIQFSLLLCTIANFLMLDYGKLTVTMTSLHLYERDANKVLQLTKPSANANESGWRGIGYQGLPWSEYVNRASNLLQATTPISEDETQTEYALRTILWSRLRETDYLKSSYTS